MLGDEPADPAERECILGRPAPAPRGKPCFAHTPDVAGAQAVAQREARWRLEDPACDRVPGDVDGLLPSRTQAGGGETPRPPRLASVTKGSVRLGFASPVAAAD